MTEEDSSNTVFYEDEDVLIGKKRTKREIIKQKHTDAAKIQIASYKIKCEFNKQFTISGKHFIRKKLY